MLEFIPEENITSDNNKEEEEGDEEEEYDEEEPTSHQTSDTSEQEPHVNIVSSTLTDTKEYQTNGVDTPFSQKDLNKNVTLDLFATPTADNRDKQIYTNKTIGTTPCRKKAADKNKEQAMVTNEVIADESLNPVKPNIEFESFPPLTSTPIISEQRIITKTGKLLNLVLGEIEEVYIYV